MKVCLPACSSPSSSQAGKLEEETFCSRSFFSLGGSRLRGSRARSSRFPSSRSTNRPSFRPAWGGHKRAIGLRVWHRTQQRWCLLKLRRKAANCPDTKQAEKPLSLQQVSPQLSCRLSSRLGRISVAPWHLSSAKFRLKAKQMEGGTIFLDFFKSLAPSRTIQLRLSSPRASLRVLCFARSLPSWPRPQ